MAYSRTVHAIDDAITAPNWTNERNLSEWDRIKRSFKMMADGISKAVTPVFRQLAAVISGVMEAFGPMIEMLQEAERQEDLADSYVRRGEQ